MVILLIGCLLLDVVFNFIGVGVFNIVIVNWIFGDGFIGMGISDVYYQYIDVNCYDVLVDIVMIDGCMVIGNYFFIVCVVLDLVVDFIWNFLMLINMNLIINFVDQFQNVVLYVWIFFSYGMLIDQNLIVLFGDIELGGYMFCLEVIL